MNSSSSLQQLWESLPPPAAILAELQRRNTELNVGSWAAENERCSQDIFHWFDNWAWTYDPRLVGTPSGAFIRLKLWPKQRDCVKWLSERIAGSEEGLLEKSRDVGATYLCAGVALYHWRYSPGFKATFGSRTVDLVDEKDNPDSIFSKIRIMLERLPAEMLPVGFVPGQHSTYMRIVNPATGAVITGEGGDEMGRSGRSSVYFLDEAAFVERAEKVERALSGNTDCVIWVSSVNGMGNLFARKRHAILKPHQIFRLHWRDDPRKTEEWAEAKKASFSELSAWASEYDIDYSASVEGICIPAAWVESAKRLPQLEPRLATLTITDGALGLDVGAGKAKSVAIVRRGPIVEPPISRGQPDTTETALWALDIAKDYGVSRLNFDAPGVGAGVQSTLMHNLTSDLEIYPVNTGLPPSQRLWPDDMTSAQKFLNLKAEGWWLARTAFQKTHQHVLFLEDREGGKEHPIDELIALPHGDQESDTLAMQLSLVKTMKNEAGKYTIEKKDALKKRGIASPDHADALILTFMDQPVHVIGASEAGFLVEPSVIPQVYGRCGAVVVDGGRVGAIWVALDRVSGALWLVDEYSMPLGQLALHAEALRKRGLWIPVLFEQLTAGRQEESVRTAHILAELSVNVFTVELDHVSGFEAISSRLATQQMKVTRTMTNWLAEYRRFRRDDKGEIEAGVLMRATALLAMHAADMAVSEAEHNHPPETEYFPQTGRSSTGY